MCVCGQKSVFFLAIYSAQFDVAVKYTDCLSEMSKTPSTNIYPGYDIKQSDCEGTVMLELLGARIIPSYLYLPPSFWPRVVVSDRFISLFQKNFLTFILCIKNELRQIELFQIEPFDLLTVCKQMTDVLF